jgi:hypothetical protein
MDRGKNGLIIFHFPAFQYCVWPKQLVICRQAKKKESPTTINAPHKDGRAGKERADSFIHVGFLINFFFFENISINFHHN